MVITKNQPLPPTQVILRFLHRAEHRANAFDLSPPQSYDLLIRIKIRNTVAAFLVASSYLGFAQYFLPCPRPDTRIMLVQRNDSDDWIQIALRMDEQTMVMIHTGIGLAIIVITALIAWHAPGPKWFVPWAQDCSNRALHHFSPDGWLGTKSVQRPSDKPKEFLRVIEEWRVPLTKCFERTTSILYWRTLLRLVRRFSCN